MPPEDRRREQRNGPGCQPRSGYAKDRNHPSQKEARPDGRKTLLQRRVPALATMPGTVNLERGLAAKAATVRWRA